MRHLVELIRRLFPCFGMEHDWEAEPGYRHAHDGVAGYRLVGHYCRRCLKFKAQGIDQIYPPKCSKCGK